MKKNLVKHAELELKKVGLFSRKSDYNGMIGKAVMELITVLSNQGHSGASINLTLSIFDKLARHDIISPLTGEKKEWVKIYKDTYQNKRHPSVFKDDKGIYFLDAIIWKNQNGICFTGTVNGITSHQYIKSFPFSPKTFYIDIVEKGEKRTIKNKKQLDAVKKYYKIKL